MNLVVGMSRASECARNGSEEANAVFAFGLDLVDGGFLNVSPSFVSAYGEAYNDLSSGVYGAHLLAEFLHIADEGIGIAAGGSVTAVVIVVADVDNNDIIVRLRKIVKLIFRYVIEFGGIFLVYGYFLASFQVPPDASPLVQ